MLICCLFYVVDWLRLMGLKSWMYQVVLLSVIEHPLHCGNVIAALPCPDNLLNVPDRRRTGWSRSNQRVKCCTQRLCLNTLSETYSLVGGVQDVTTPW